MRVKFLEGVSGEWKGESFQYPRGGTFEVADDLAASEIHAGHAEPVSGNVFRRIVEKISDPEAITPEIFEDDIKKAVIKRRKRV